MKPVFQDLTNENLLKGCLGGYTQNANECFNSVLWSRLPKNIFIGIDNFNLGVKDAVITFNDGAVGRLEILKVLNLPYSNQTEILLSNIDEERNKQVEKRKNSKSYRQSIRITNDDTFDHYNPGMN